MKKIKVQRVLIFILVLIVGAGASLYIFNQTRSQPSVSQYTMPNINIKHDFLTVNPYSRSGKALTNINGIVIHYTANANSTAQNNRDYFEKLKTLQTTSASSHFIIGLQGEIIQCIPLNEIAYASNNRNGDTIAIEVCHPDASGQFNEKTYAALQALVTSLMDTYDLDKDDILRHYDITGKNCPKYFVENEDAWEEFLDSL